MSKPSDLVAIIVEDLEDNCLALSKIANTLIERGATKIYVVCTHAIFSDQMIEELNGSQICKFITTNSLMACDSAKLCSKVEIIGMGLHFLKCSLNVYFLFQILTL